MIEEIKYFILGLIQGLAEFFPISSSGHILLFSSILNVAEKNPLLLSVIVHFATTLSTIIVYHNRIKNILLGVFRNKNQEHISFFFKLIVSSFPLIIAGFFLKNKIDFIFHNATHLVFIMLICTGVILICSTFFKVSKSGINFSQALIMGFAQAIAIIPGLSRSGITISTALLLKIKRKEAAEFSFLMVLFPIMGVTIMEVLFFINSDSIIEDIEIKGLIIAFFSSFFSGLFACKYMIKIVQKNNLKYFGYYCLIIGIVWGIIH